MTRILSWITNATTAIGALAVFLMMAEITADVTAKYLLQSPLPGTITFVSNYWMVLVVFLPLAMTERHNGHISVEVLTTHFPLGVQRVLSIIAMCLTALVFAALAWQGWIEANRAFASGAFEIEQGRKILIWPARYLMPIGCGLMVIMVIAKIAIALRRGARLDHEKPFF